MPQGHLYFQHHLNSAESGTNRIGSEESSTLQNDTAQGQVGAIKEFARNGSNHWVD